MAASTAEREFVELGTNFQVRVFQWNVLADSCATDADQGFPYVPKEALDPILRRPMQLKEILADDADVIALEEVDSPHDFKFALEHREYKVLYNRREDSPLGVLVAYKENKYTLKAKNMITFTNGGQVATVLLLEDKTSGREFVFAAAHLKAKDDEASQRVRKLQSTELMSHVTNMSDDWEERCTWNKRYAEMKGHIVLVGDLNDAARSDAVREWTDLDGFGLALPENYDNTTFKMRKGSGWKGAECCTEDYIIHNGTTTRVRPLPQDFEDPYLPSKDFPSDHLSLCADILFVK